MSKKGRKTLRTRKIVAELIEKHNYNGTYKLTGINPGILHRIMNGGSSKTAEKKLKETGYLHVKRRVRLCVDTTDEVIKRFDKLRGDMSRAEYLEWLLPKGDLPDDNV